MGTFFIYIVKASACLSLFYLFYRVLLSRETFHCFNRIVLLSILSLSLLVPLIEFTTDKQTEVTHAFAYLEQAMSGAKPFTDATTPMANNPTLWIVSILFLYITGMLFFIVRSIYMHISLCLLVRSGVRKSIDNGVTLIVHTKDIAPFSWMNYIVVAKKDLAESGREILLHERAHIDKWHSADLLVADIVIFFQWFNPAAWLLKQELRNIHEYEADEAVLNKGVDAKQYQLLLIKKAVGARLYSMANSFDHSNLKKRITMMLKEKSNSWAYAKCLYVLPLAAIAVTVFARPEISNKLDRFSEVKVSDFLATNATDSVIKETRTTTVTREGGSTVTTTTETTFVTDSMMAGKTSDGDEVMTISIKKDGKNSPVLINEIVTSGLRKGKAGSFGASYTSVSSNSTALPGSIFTVNGEKVDTTMITYSTIKVHGIDAKNLPLVVIDGAKYAYRENLEELVPANEIEGFSILKDEDAVKIYGDEGKNGVIVIVTKKGSKPRKGKAGSFGTSYTSVSSNSTALPGSIFTVNDEKVDTTMITYSTIKVHGIDAKKPPLVVIDGEKHAYRENLEELVPANEIESFSILKDENAMKIYGDEGKNGVILIVTKKGSKPDKKPAK